jgi:hypothetical protein
MRLPLAVLVASALLSVVLGHSVSSLSSLSPPIHSPPASATFAYYTDINCSVLSAGPFNLDYYTPPSCIALSDYSYVLNCTTSNNQLDFHFYEWTNSTACQGDNPVKGVYSGSTLAPCAPGHTVEGGVVTSEYMTVSCDGGGGSVGQLSSTSSPSSLPSTASSVSLSSSGAGAPSSSSSSSFSITTIALIIVSVLLVIAALATCWLLSKRGGRKLADPVARDDRRGALQQPLVFHH